MTTLSRSAATFVGIAVPGLLIAVTAFVAPLPSGSGARGPEQVRLPASATAQVCPGPLDLAEQATGTDEEFEASEPPATVARAVSVPMTAPDGSEAAAGIEARILGGDALFDTEPGDPFVTGADGMGAPVLYTGKPAGESPALLSTVQTAQADDGDYAGLAALSCSSPVTRATFSAASTMPGEDSRILIGNPTDAPVTVQIALTGESGPVAVAGQDSLTVQPHSMRTVVVGALATGVPILGVEVTAADGRVTAIMQHVRQEGLESRGIEYAAPEAPAATSAHIPFATAGQVRLRVSNHGETAVTAELGGHSAEGPVDLESTSVSIPARGTVDVDLGALEPGALTLEADGDITATATVTVEAEVGGDAEGDAGTGSGAGEDVAHYPSAPALGDAQLVTLPTTETGVPLDGELMLAAGTGEVGIVPIGGDGQRGDRVSVQLNPDQATAWNWADVDARALEIHSGDSDAFAALGVRSDAGASAVGIPAPPAGIGYRNVRIDR